jgi:hypothetical protein
MKSSPGYRFSKSELDWVAANLDDARGWARGDRIITWTLVVTFLIGLVVYLVGFALGSGSLELPNGWPSDLIADLLANLGVVLWTSVILVLFLEILPNWQQRRAQAWARGALIALRERGDEAALALPAEDMADPVAAKLDAILARLGDLETAVGRRGDPPP